MQNSQDYSALYCKIVELNKKTFHIYEYLHRWLAEQGFDKYFIFDEVWRMGEAWIAFLGEN